MKILYYNHTGQVSGAERVLLMILAKLDRTIFQAELLSPRGELPNAATALGVTHSEIDNLSARFTRRPDHLFRYLKSFTGLMRQVRSRVKSSQPDLIHANSVRAGLLMTISTAGLKVPVLWHVHDMLPHHPLSTAIRLVVFCSRRTRVLSISNAVRERFCGDLLRGKERAANLILNAVDLERFRPDMAARDSIREELGLTQGDSVVGIVGQITPRKNQQGVLEAFGLVVKQLPLATLLIVGAPLFNDDDEYQKGLERTIDDHFLVDRVKFLGARNDVPAITNALDVSIVNSRIEPFGLVVAEAMACGVPVLATAVDGISEIVTHGEDGWLVPSQDKAALASAIVDLIKSSDLRSQLAARGLETVRRRFNSQRYMSEMQECYLDTLGPGTAIESRPLMLRRILGSFFFILAVLAISFFVFKS